MIERIELGSTPCDEQCAQVGADNYYEMAKKECRVYANQLKRMLAKEFPEVPESFSIVTKGSSHDYGTYYEVVAKFDGDDEKAWGIAVWLENNSPANWDDTAKQELKN